MKKQADLVLKNGVIYTADADDNVYEALAVGDNEIIFVGTATEAETFIGEGTEVIDLGGKMVIPGMTDSHIHPPGLALHSLYEVQLDDVQTVGGWVGKVRDFVTANPGKPVYGRGWSWAVLRGEEAERGPRKEYLDAVATDVPVILRSSDGHTLWVNSFALAQNGINKATPEPEGGSIMKDPLTGELWGTFKESAMRFLPLARYTLEQYYDAMLLFQEKMHSLGITAILSFSSMMFEDLFQVMMRMEREGRLKLHVRGAMTFSPKEELVTQTAMIEEARKRYKTDLIGVTTVKFFADGVVEGGTSCLFEPYEAGLGLGKPEDYCGDFLWDKDEMAAAFQAVNERGLQIHVHSTGDRATAYTLDALEKSGMKVQGEDCRNTITHLQLVAPQDIKRFKELKVIANVQPYWHFKGADWWAAVDKKFLGERAEREFPLASFFREGVLVAASSDYPATLIPNPLEAIQIGVMRSSGAGADGMGEDEPQCLLGGEERAEVRDMLRSFTINNAYSMFMEDRTGSLEVGKQADFVVLSDNLLAVEPSRIACTKVLMTFFNGEKVYSG